MHLFPESYISCFGAGLVSTACLPTSGESSKLSASSLRAHLCGACQCGSGWQSEDLHFVSQTSCCLQCELPHSTHKWGVSGLRAQLSCGWESVTCLSALSSTCNNVEGGSCRPSGAGETQVLRGPEAPVFFLPVRPLQCSPPCAYCSSIRELKPGGTACLSFSCIPGHVVL